ncbi:MAG: hypothetical protein JWM58_128 [Rhizobium sp.]|nr:hypothetical protein [Rhizobium sp.]
MMSNDVTPARSAPDVAAGHQCQNPDCQKWGGWGYDRGSGVIGWWCLEHRPDTDPVQPEITGNWISDGNEG